MSGKQILQSLALSVVTATVTALIVSAVLEDRRQSREQEPLPLPPAQGEAEV